MTVSVTSLGSAGQREDEIHPMRLRARLMRETGCTEAEVGFAVGLALERFRGARVREFVTLLAERDARRRLRALQRHRSSPKPAGARAESGRHHGQHDC